jgi:hypothetical protein
MCMHSAFPPTHLPTRPPTHLGEPEEDDEEDHTETGYTVRGSIDDGAVLALVLIRWVIRWRSAVAQRVVARWRSELFGAVRCGAVRTILKYDLMPSCLF